MKKPAILASLKKRLAASGPGLTVAIIAMIVALAGTAYAATKLNSTQKKEVEKIAKKYAGKPGENGAPGAPGAKGDAGGQGIQGPPGTNGKNPKIVDEDPDLCGTGIPGVIYEVENSTEEAELCDGAEGPEGSPWTDGGSLPPGATETGTWGTQGEGAKVGAPITFAIPLEGLLTAGHVHFPEDPGFSTVCPGNVDNPKAKPGELCVYEGLSEGVPQFDSYRPDLGTQGASRAGAVVVSEMITGGLAFGTYAVTGCDPVPTNPSPCPA